MRKIDTPITIKINKLGPITNSNIDFKPLMLLSGDSSLGKSYTAFLMYYCIEFLTSPNHIQNYLKHIINIEEVESKLFYNNSSDIYINISKIEEQINKNAHQFLSYLLGYENINVDISVKLNIHDLKLHIASEKGNIEYSYDGIAFQTGYSSTSPQNSISNLIALSLKYVLFKKLISLKPILLPPARAALVHANYSTLKEITQSAGMYHEFAEDLDDLKSITKFPIEVEQDVLKLITSIFGGQIQVNKGEIEFKSESSTLPLSAAASSIKELSPLFLALKRRPLNECSFLLEEPEAHLHPALQTKVADLITLMVNHGSYFQITTHSDYFMHEINNLIRLYQINKQDRDAFNKFCKEHNYDSNITLNPNLVGAYYFNKREDGSVEIISQNASNGIPFQTFERTIDDLMPKTSIIEDFLEEISND